MSTWNHQLLVPSESLYKVKHKHLIKNSTLAYNIIIFIIVKDILHSDVVYIYSQFKVGST